MVPAPKIDQLTRLLRLLGLASEAPTAERDRAARTLGAHIGARRDHSKDPTFRAARQAELEVLEQSLSITRDKATKRTPVRLSPQLLWLVLLGLAALVGIRFGLADRATASHPEPAPTPATLSVLADPEGATFWLLDPTDDSVLTHEAADGRRTLWAAGPYRLRVEHSDCPEDWSRDINLPAGDSKSYAPKLCAGKGELIVRSNQTEERVRIDGRDVGATGKTAHSLRTGKHRVTVEKSGFSPWQAEISIEPGRALTLHAELTALASSTPPPPAAAQPATPAGPGAPEPPQSTAPPPGGAPTVPGSLPRAAAGSAGLGGSKTWHDAVKHELVRTYDRNGSRSLDTSEEIRAITCTVWRDIEAQYETGGLAVKMTHLYGFDGSDAPANTLGVTYGLRSETYQRMKECGLKTRL